MGIIWNEDKQEHEIYRDGVKVGTSKDAKTVINNPHNLQVSDNLLNKPEEANG